MKLYKKCLAFVVVLALGMIPQIVAAETEGRTLSIFRVEGENAFVTRGTPQEIDARAGLRLSEGYRISTGRETNVYIRIDTDSLVKMDQNSQVAVSRASRDRLSFSVESGNALINVDRQEQQGRTIESRIGSTALTVRGTIFIMGRSINGGITITMLEGSGEVDDIILEAGMVMRIFEETGEVNISYALVLEEMDAFTLQALLDYQEILLTNGTISQEMLDAVPGLLEQRIEELAVVSQAYEEAVAHLLYADVILRDPATPPVGYIPEPNVPGQHPEVNLPGPSPEENTTEESDDPPGSSSNNNNNNNNNNSNEFPGAPPRGSTYPYPFIITAEYVGWLHDFFQNDPRSLNQHFRLAADITMQPNFIIAPAAGYVEHGHTVSLIPLSPFNGTFDGAGHTVNVNVDITSGTYALVGGLFGHLGPDGVVRNVTISGFVSASHSVTALLGGAVGWNEGLVDNVIVADSVVNVFGGNRGRLVGGNAGMILDLHHQGSPFARGLPGGSLNGIAHLSAMEFFSIEFDLNAGYEDYDQDDVIEDSDDIIEDTIDDNDLTPTEPESETDCEYDIDCYDPESDAGNNYGENPEEPKEPEDETCGSTEDESADEPQDDFKKEYEDSLIDVKDAFEF